MDPDTASLQPPPPAPAGDPASAVEPAPSSPEAARPGRSLLAFGLTLVGAAALLFTAHRYASRQAPAGAAGTPVSREGVGQAVPDFTLKDIRGNNFRMADLKGKVVIVDFWATWCAPCKVEIPWFVDMYDRYRARGLEVVGIAMDEEGVDVVRPFAEEFKMNYRVLLGSETVATQFGGIYGLPTTLIIGRDGKIHDKHVGLVSRQVFEDTVKALL